MELTIQAGSGQNVLPVLPLPTLPSTLSKMTSSSVPLLGLALATASVPAAGLGCGRRATEADCRLIVDRSVELESREMSETDPKTIADREARIRAELEDQIKECESRRVTDRTMGCVQSAKSSQELETCLR
jgi:hypothetical protein